MRLLVWLGVLLSALSVYGDDASTVMFMGGPQHNNVGSGSVPRGLAWTVKTGNKVRSTAAVFNGAVYFGSNDGNLYAVDLKSGKTNWRFTTQGAVSSSPAIAKGLVLFQSEDGYFYAVTAAKGEKKWAFKTGPELKFTGRWDYYLSSPVVSGDTVYFGAGDGKVYALEIATGTQQWSFATQGRVRATPAVYEGVVYAGSMDGTLYALDSNNGSLKWKFKTVGSEYFPVGEIQSSPTIANGMVYFGSRDATLYAVDARTGAKRWAAVDSAGSWVISSPAYAEGLIVTGSSDARYVQALNATTGELKWKQKVSGNVFGSALIANGLVYIGDWHGGMLWLDLMTGKVIDGYVVDGPIQSSAVFGDGLLLFGSDNDSFYALK